MTDNEWPPPQAPQYVPPPPQYPAYGYGFVSQAPASTNGFAIAALVLGILWIYWLGSLLAVIFGHVALNHIDRDRQGGRGMAIAGLVLGYVGLGILALVIIVAIMGAAAGPM